MPRRQLTFGGAVHRACVKTGMKCRGWHEGRVRERRASPGFPGVPGASKPRRLSQRFVLMQHTVCRHTYCQSSSPSQSTNLAPVCRQLCSSGVLGHTRGRTARPSVAGQWGCLPDLRLASDQSSVGGLHPSDRPARLWLRLGRRGTCGGASCSSWLSRAWQSLR